MSNLDQIHLDCPTTLVATLVDQYPTSNQQRISLSMYLSSGSSTFLALFPLLYDINPFLYKEFPPSFRRATVQIIAAHTSILDFRGFEVQRMVQIRSAPSASRSICFESKPCSGSRLALKE
jgi:hypothetical protein